MYKRPVGIRELLQNIQKIMDVLKSVQDPNQIDRAKKLLSYYEKPVQKAMKDLKIGENPVLWALTPREKQQKAMSAFNYLFDVLSIGLGPEVGKFSEK